VLFRISSTGILLDIIRLKFAFAKFLKMYWVLIQQLIGNIILLREWPKFIRTRGRADRTRGHDFFWPDLTRGHDFFR